MLSSFAYTHDMRGNQLTKTDHTGRTTEYTYDGLNRLVREKVSGGGGGARETVYGYDLRHNRVSMTVTGVGAKSVTYAYDLCDRLTSESTVSGGSTVKMVYSHDASGNVVRRQTERTGGGLWTHEFGEEDGKKLELRAYDGFGRLTAVNNDKANAYYSYNPDGLRAAKSVDGQISVHLWDGQNIAAEVFKAPNGTQTGSAVYLRGVNLIATRKSGGAATYCLHDAHGDIVNRTGANGVSLWYNEYDAFGGMTSTAGVGNPSPQTPDDCPFGYCGEYLDNETGTVYLRARSYDPSIGRMMSEDPVRGVWRELPGGKSALDPLSLNLYTYCAGNPIRYKDATGKFAIVDDAAYIIVGAGLIVLGAAVFVSTYHSTGDVNRARQQAADNLAGNLQSIGNFVTQAWTNTRSWVNERVHTFTTKLPDITISRTEATTRARENAVYQLAYVDKSLGAVVVVPNIRMTYEQAVAALLITGVANEILTPMQQQIKSFSTQRSGLWGIYTTKQTYAAALAHPLGMVQGPEYNVSGGLGHYHAAYAGVTHGLHI